MYEIKIYNKYSIAGVNITVYRNDIYSKYVNVHASYNNNRYFNYKNLNIE